VSGYVAPPRRERPKPPVLSTKERLFVALWRFKMEVDAMDWSTLAMTEADIAEIRADWAKVVTSLRDGLALAPRREAAE
jgi:hypothetical protein